MAGGNFKYLDDRLGEGESEGNGETLALSSSQLLVIRERESDGREKRWRERRSGM